MLVGEYGDSAIPPDVIEECKTYLITSDREGEDWLMQLHWEADALWMLSSDGLLVDLQRQKEEDTPQNRLAKLHFNLGLHREVVGKVYANVYSRTEFEKFGFHDGLLYRSATGYGIAERLVREGELLVAPSPSAAKVTSKETLSMIAKSRLLVKDIENGDYFSLLDAMNEWGLDNFDSYETILVLIKRGFAREVSIEELRKEGVLRKRDERYKDNIYFRLSANGKGALVRAINEIQTVPTIPAFSPSAAKINDSAEPTTPYLLQALDAAA
jgi:hypothetical protein